VLRLIPERAHGLQIINNEADMKVGFDRPFEPRLTEQFPAWLAASPVVHESLSAKYGAHEMHFLAAADDTNQQLVQAPFDGRRSIMTRASADVNAASDLVVRHFEIYRPFPVMPGLDPGIHAPLTAANRARWAAAPAFTRATLELAGPRGCPDRVRA
jgi:hypothetical protein